jgi:hypothetical protein
VAPKRLLLGNDVYAVATAALHQRLDELESGKDVANFTDAD